MSANRYISESTQNQVRQRAKFLCEYCHASEQEYIENNYSANFPDEVINRLTEIQKTLNTSDQTAAAKLKLALPLLPSVLSYELELDTEGVLRKIFQPIRRLFKAKKKSR